MTSDPFRADDLGAFVAALPNRLDTLVFAPQGTVNAAPVHGDQSLSMSAPVHSGPASGPMRQGPVRAKRLAAARRCFVAPPGFDDALAALDSGIVVLTGEPGTGRETHALNLLAHGRAEPVIVQVDGAVNLLRWTPRPRGVHGYLVMEPPDLSELRAWDLSRLEAPLAEAGARLVIVAADAPGPAMFWRIAWARLFCTTFRPIPGRSSPPISRTALPPRRRPTSGYVRCHPANATNCCPTVCHPVMRRRPPRPYSGWVSPEDPPVPTWYGPWPGRRARKSSPVRRPNPHSSPICSPSASTGVSRAASSRSGRRNCSG